MKHILLLVLLAFSGLAQATDIVKATHETTIVSVHDLSCRTRFYFGADQPAVQTTELGTSLIWGSSAGEFKLKHPLAVGEGCPQELILSILNISARRFSYIGADLDTTLTLFTPFVNGLNKCVQRIQEKVEININGLKVVSDVEELRDSSACD